MSPEILFRQIETYSNAIVSFTVLQGVAFSFAFGTNAFFNCLVKTSAYLAEGLVLAFLLVAILSVVAIMGLGRALKQLAGEFRGIVNRIYLGKLVTLTIFSLLPLVLTMYYGVRDYPAKAECAASTRNYR